MSPSATRRVRRLDFFFGLDLGFELLPFFDGLAGFEDISESMVQEASAGEKYGERYGGESASVA